MGSSENVEPCIYFLSTLLHLFSLKLMFYVKMLCHRALVISIAIMVKATTVY